MNEEIDSHKFNQQANNRVTTNDIFTFFAKMKIHPIFMTLLGSIIVADSVVVVSSAAANEQRQQQQQQQQQQRQRQRAGGGGGVRRRNPNRPVRDDAKKSQILEEAAQQQPNSQQTLLPSDFPSMSPIGQEAQEPIEDAQQLPSDFPSMSPTFISNKESPADTAAGVVAVIKECNDTSTAEIRFENQAELQVFATCSDIVDNNWQDVACPQSNEHV
jgi:cell division protein FtsB